MQNKSPSIPETCASWKPLTSYLVCLFVCFSNPMDLPTPCSESDDMKGKTGEPPPFPVPIISQTKIEPWWNGPAGRNKMKPVGLTFTCVLYV